MVTETETYSRRLTSGTISYTGPNPNPPWTWTNSTLTRTNSITKGGPIPDWRRKIARGENCTTILDGLEYNYAWTNGYRYHAKQHWNGVMYQIYGAWGVFHPASYPSFGTSTAAKTHAENEAKRYVSGRSQDQLRSMQTLVTLGELGETVRMINGAASGVDKHVNRYLDNVKRHYRTVGRRIDAQNRFLADQWLQAQYGILPLLSDTDNLARTLATDFSIRREHELVVGRGEVEEGGVPLIRTGTYSGGDGYAYTERTKHRYVVIYRAMVGLSESNLRRLSYQTAGAGWREWLPTVYELTPWSFLVDYFTNVNEIVNAFSYGRHGILWINRTTVQESEHSIVTHGFSPSPTNALYTKHYDTQFQPSSSTAQLKQVNRGTYSGSLIPSLEFEIPTGPRKWSSMAALAYNNKLVRTLIGKWIKPN